MPSAPLAVACPTPRRISYSSVRRCDDTVGATLEVLRQHGAERDTLVTFLSDNGMAFPFAKTNCYLHSTRTPWIVRWPPVVRPGSADHAHFILRIDLMPTLLDAAGLTCPAGVDGRTFLPLLRGERQAGRNAVFTQFHQTAGRRNYPMRCVQSARYGYLFNPWSNGERIFRNESQTGRSFPAMLAAAEKSPEIAARVHLFLRRVPEELYDFDADPDALHNRIDDPACATELAALRERLERWMEANADPALEAFRTRDSNESKEAFMRETAERLAGHS